MASFTLFIQASIPRYLKSFPFFMLITLVVEITGSLLGKHTVAINLLYCFFTAFEFVYYLLLIKYIIYNQKIKKTISWILAVYPVLVVIDVFFIQPREFHSITYSLGCLLVVLACIYYFLEIFQSKYSVNLVKEPAFWICTALLFYYCCTFPLFGVWNLLKGLPGIILQNLNTILTILNYLLYSLFSIAFLCRIRVRKSLQ